jgi:hypothetical protein
MDMRVKSVFYHDRSPIGNESRNRFPVNIVLVDQGCDKEVLLMSKLLLQKEGVVPEDPQTILKEVTRVGLAFVLEPLADFLPVTFPSLHKDSELLVVGLIPLAFPYG